MPTSEGKITIQVSLRSILRKYRPDPNDRRPFAVEVTAGATETNLVAALGMDEKLAKLAFVGHVRCDGARADMFPPIAGGRVRCGATTG